MGEREGEAVVLGVHEGGAGVKLLLKTVLVAIMGEGLPLSEGVKEEVRDKNCGVSVPRVVPVWEELLQVDRVRETLWVTLEDMRGLKEKEREEVRQ